VYRRDGKPVNAGRITTFNEYAIVSENRVTTIPADSDMEIAALFGCAVTTGFGVVVNNARLSIGESVVVFGAGGVGLNIVQAARLVSAYPIIAVDLHDNRLALARELGATHLVNAAKEDPREALKRLTGEHGIDAFIDNTGRPEIIELGYELTRDDGRVVLVGVPAKGRNISIYSLPLHFEKELSGSHGGEAVPNEDIPRYMALHRNGVLKLGSLVTDRCGLHGINDSIERMRTGEIGGRCLIRFT
jgi:S-(hydroxymethyl)glutathione dehydrogenase/alcohol dehydrogenase